MANENAPRSVSIDPLKYLNRLPEFSGDYRDLQTFLNLVDRVHPLLRTYDEPSQLLFSDIIKSRLKGKAREIIEINCQAQSWNDVKTILINNFGERFSLEELFDRLKSVYFKNNSVEFYNEIKNRLRSLNNKTICLVGSGPGANECARNNMRTALNVFKEKMPEPMRTILTCRNPDSLEEAMEILFQSGYAYHSNNGAFGTNKGQQNSSNGKNQQGKGKSNQNDHNANKSRHNNVNQHYRNNQQNNWSQHNNNQQPRYENAGYRSNHYNQHPPEPMDINMVENHNQPHNQENGYQTAQNNDNSYYHNGNQTDIAENHNQPYNQENGCQTAQGNNNSYYHNDNQHMPNNTSTNFLIQASRENYPI